MSGNRCGRDDSRAAIPSTDGHIAVGGVPDRCVLAAAITDTLAGGDRAGSSVITTLQRDRPDLQAVATAIAQLHNHGRSPSWRVLYPHARTIGLLTYAFQHRRYWLAPSGAGDADSLGLDRPEHPLLGAVAELAGHDQVVVTGRWSATSHWLADHRVHTRVVFPAAGFIEVVLRAGDYVGCPVIEELVVHTPLVLSSRRPPMCKSACNPPMAAGGVALPFTLAAAMSTPRRAGRCMPAAW